jgi:uncharacterized membrane protein YgcG
MRSPIDLGSWQGIVSTLLGLILVTVVAVGLRLLVMQRVQQRRERQNRQINERLRTLIAAYKTLGGSFTGNLAVDPAHRRDSLRMRAAGTGPFAPGGAAGGVRAADLARDGGAMVHGDDHLDEGQTRTAAGAEDPGDPDGPGAERRRRIRDAVEAALSDVILLGTAEQVRLAAQAAADMVAGRRIETAALVRSLRDFIREVLDLDAVPADVVVPDQGPLRTAAGAGRGGGGGGGGRSGGGGGRGGSGMAGGGGLAAGGALGLGAGRRADEPGATAGPDIASP